MLMTCLMGRVYFHRRTTAEILMGMDQVLIVILGNVRPAGTTAASRSVTMTELPTTAVSTPAVPTAQETIRLGLKALMMGIRLLEHHACFLLKHMDRHTG